MVVDSGELGMSTQWPDGGKGKHSPKKAPASSNLILNTHDFIHISIPLFLFPLLFPIPFLSSLLLLRRSSFHFCIPRLFFHSHHLSFCISFIFIDVIPPPQRETGDCSRAASRFLYRMAECCSDEVAKFRPPVYFWDPNIDVP